MEQAQANRAQAARDLQVARARVALLPDLPLSAGGPTLSAGATGAFTPTSAAGQGTQGFGSTPAAGSSLTGAQGRSTTGQAPAGAAQGTTGGIRQ
jgi:hypothetical protein